MTHSLACHQVLAPITALENVAPGHFQMALYAPTIAASARAGQFIHVLPRDVSAPSPLLRRAFSILSARLNEIEILFRVEGEGTAQIAKKSIGETLDIIGPLGQPFDLELFHVKQPQEQTDFYPILAGGGVGVPPMVFLSRVFRERGVDPLMLIGARSKGELLGLETFRDLGVETRVATDDGSAGHQGRITELLEAELSAVAGANRGQAVIYACGPLPMLRAVAQVAALYGAPCQVSLEENMPCGIGVCNGCVVAMKNAEMPHSEVSESEIQLNSDYGRYQRICVNGPALWADRIDWEAL